MEGKELIIVDSAPVTAKALQQQVQAIQQAMKDVMQVDTHYGVIPGCGDKPALLKAGAEKIGLMFRLVPTFKIDERNYGEGHREFVVTCTLSDPSGRIVGQGVGSCSTLEAKYKYRKAERTCPNCGKATIIKGKEQFGGGWLCWGKKGGCGAKFQDGDASIESQPAGRIENQDIADQYNTVLKMAKKRAHVDAILTTTAASDIFTQDIDDNPPAPDENASSKADKPSPQIVPANKLVKQEHSHSQHSPKKIEYIYELSALPEDKEQDVMAYIEENKAVWNSELRAWVSSKPLVKLKTYEVERFALEKFRASAKDDLPEEWGINTLKEDVAQ